MITDSNSEDRPIQQTFADHIHNQLGWQSVYTYKTESFGPQIYFRTTNIASIHASLPPCIEIPRALRSYPIPIGRHRVGVGETSSFRVSLVASS